MADFSQEDRPTEDMLKLQAKDVRVDQGYCGGNPVCYVGWQNGHSYLNYLAFLPKIGCSPVLGTFIYSSGPCIHSLKLYFMHVAYSLI